MLSIKDGELINKMKALTFIHIQDLMVLRHKETVAHPSHNEMCEAYGVDPTETANPPIEVLQETWSGSLQTASIHILWAVLARAEDGVFTVNDENMASIVAAIDVDKEVSTTALVEEDVPVIFKHLCDSLVQIVKENGLVSTHINRQPILLK